MKLYELTLIWSRKGPNQTAQLRAMNMNLTEAFTPRGAGLIMEETFLGLC